MKDDVKRLWVEALRSGEYPQTIGSLHRLKASPNKPEGWCCLGVLCDVARKNGVEITVKDRYTYAHAEDAETPENVEYFDNHDEFLPPSVLEWSEFDQDDDNFYWESDGESSVQRSLIEHNDNGVSFDLIANMIEEQA